MNVGRVGIRGEAMMRVRRSVADISAIAMVIMGTAPPASAQTPSSTDPAPEAPTIKCTDVRKTGNYTTTSSWDGPCIDGIATGTGKLTSDTIGPDTVSRAVLQGTLIDGRQAGMWCTLVSQVTSAGSTTDFSGDCTLGYNRPPPQYGAKLYRPLPNGDWRLRAPMIGQGNEYPVPVVIAKAGMDAAIAAATPNATTLPDMAFTSPMLDGLTPGSAGVAAGEMNAMPDISGKRIALVLTNRAVAELDRFAKQRNAFIKSNGYGKKFSDGVGFTIIGTRVDSSLPGIIAATDPARFVPSIIGAMRPQIGTGEIVPADDLGVLTNGGADYAIVLDWSFDGGILSPSEFEKIPVCDPKNSLKCASMFTEHYQALVIDPRIRAVSILSSYSSPHPRFVKELPYVDQIVPYLRILWQGDGDYTPQTMFGELGAGIPWSKMEPIVQQYLGTAKVPTSIKPDKSRAISLLNVATLRPDGGSALRMYGDLYLDGTLSKDGKQATEYYLKAAAAGDQLAMVYLTSIYSAGSYGLPRDLALARKYIDLAYAAGQTKDTTYNLGIALANGWGGAVDLPGALKAFEASAKLGAPNAAARIAEVRARLDAASIADQQAKAAVAADAAFAASLGKVPNAAELFAMADELASKGETQKAQQAFRALLTRFPASPLAATAAQRLSTLSSK